MVNIIIEIPLGSRIKYEMNKELNCIQVDRYINTPLPYPFNYGYFPNTLAEDNDPLDAILLIEEKIYPESLIECEIIGGIEMVDNNENDHKIFVKPLDKMNFPNTFMIENNQISKLFEKQVRFFLENY